MKLTRRDFLRYSTSIAATIGVSTALSGCSLSQREEELSEVRFDHGVASGDPSSDGMILWTRAAPTTALGAVMVGWEVSSDRDFRNIVRSGVTASSAAQDFTVKVDVRELAPGQDYFYRFRGATGQSMAGRARTLPEGRVEELRMAIFSCSNYPAGYFHAYAEASRQGEVDVFLHLGDYLYEYGEGGYATERAAELGRAFDPDNTGELLSLTDYRRRYALYRSDTDLQAIHAAAPMIAVWDDHEIANDTWHSGAENHGPDEGEFSRRKAAAVLAYFEWLPLRPPLPDREGRIYRRFRFGDLVDLHMLDTRIVGRDRQLEYGDFVDAESGAMDGKAFGAALSNPSRSLLGDEQRRWLYEGIADSNARWQVLGQQILMARMVLPVEILRALFTEQNFASAEILIGELARLKASVVSGESLSAEQERRLATALPYNLDAWDGYPVERARLYAAAQQAGKNLVVLAGDTHNAWQSVLRDRSGQKVGIELATPGVSSPGMEEYLQLDEEASQRLAAALVQLIDELEYCELRRRGFLEVAFSRESVTARWHFVDDVTRRDYRVSTHTWMYQ